MVQKASKSRAGEELFTANFNRIGSGWISKQKALSIRRSWNGTIPCRFCAKLKKTPIYFLMVFRAVIHQRSKFLGVYKCVGCTLLRTLSESELP